MNQSSNVRPSRGRINRRTVAYVTGIVLLCALILVNVLIYALPAQYTLFDTSGNPASKISDSSEAFVAELKEDVTVYWLCADGVTNTAFSQFLLRYAEAGERIRLQIVDTTIHPDFVKKYTDGAVSNYSLIVESEKRHQIIDVMDMYYYINDFINSLAETTYPMTLAQYEELRASSYGTYMDQTTTSIYFKGEALLTTALDYVTREQIPHAYVLTGHGETAMSDTLKSIFASVNVIPQTLDAKTATAIPADANCVLLFSPEDDLSDHEVAVLTAYIKNGGSFLLVAGPDTSDFKNLASVCALFGMSPSGGIVVDPNTDNYKGDPSRLVPLINSKHAAMYAVGSSGFLAYMPNAMGITLADKDTLPSGVTTQVLLGTSDKGYRVSKDSARTPLCKPAAQIVAAAGTLATTTPDGTTDNAYFAWFASDEAFTDTAAKVSSNGNYYYLAMTASWMSVDESFSSKYSGIAAVDLSTPMLDNMTTTSAIVIGIVIVVVLPLGMITTGLAIWLKRRRR